MGISNREIGTTIPALRCVFWGGLICVLDFTIAHSANGRGWRFDILNDFVGMLLITWGVFRLAGVNVSERYRASMRFVQIVAVLSCVDALHQHFIYDTPAVIQLFFFVLGVAAMIATVVFCVAMRRLSEEAGFPRSARSWRTTTVLFVCICVIPVGLFYCAAAVAVATGTSFSINPGDAGLLLIPVFCILCIPLIHLFISTSRMKSDAVSSLMSGQPSGPVDGDASGFDPHQP